MVVRGTRRGRQAIGSDVSKATVSAILAETLLEELAGWPAARHRSIQTIDALESQGLRKSDSRSADSFTGNDRCHKWQVTVRKSEQPERFLLIQLHKLTLQIMSL